jgi:energy-converting hydrogenase Eha subunit E
MTTTRKVMATALHQTVQESQAETFVQRWFYTGMALVMLMTVLLAFVPSIAHPAGRCTPLSILAAAHGIVFLAWLVIFLVQSWLVATRHVAWHKRLGLASIFILAAMIPLAYETTIGMVRRGFDLSGDLAIGAGNDPTYQAVFPLFNILIVSALVIGALAYRSRSCLIYAFAAPNGSVRPASIAGPIGRVVAFRRFMRQLLGRKFISG